MNKPTCGTCPYWTKKLGMTGECRISAPQLVAAVYSKWPECDDMDTCGDHPQFTAWLESSRCDDCCGFKTKEHPMGAGAGMICPTCHPDDDS